MKYLISGIIVILFSFNCFSQTKAPSIQPYFSALVVTDIESSISWYSKNFGFDVLSRLNLEEHRLKQANLKRGDILLELIEIGGTINRKTIMEEHPDDKFIQGIMKFGFRVKDIDEYIKHLKANEVTFYGNVVKDPNTGERMVIIKDPDENLIQLFEKQ